LITTPRAGVWSHCARAPSMQKMLLSVEKIQGVRTISHKKAGYNKKGESIVDSPLWSGREDSNLRPSEPHAGKPSANVHCSPRRARSGVCWGYLGAFTPVRGRPRPSLFASHFHLNFHGISRIGRGRERPPPWPSRSRRGPISASPWRTNGAKASAFHDPTPASSTLQVGET